MKEIAVIGLDLAKAVFQVHGVDAEGAYGSQETTNQDPDGLVFCSLGTLPGGHGVLWQCTLLGTPAP